MGGDGEEVKRPRRTTQFRDAVEIDIVNTGIGKNNYGDISAGFGWIFGEDFFIEGFKRAFGIITRTTMSASYADTGWVGGSVDV